MSSTAPIPPKLAHRFLQWFLRDDLLEEVEGDLEEKYFITLEKSGRRKASMEYWYQVVQYLRPFAISRKRFQIITTLDMVRNYLKIGWRSLFKNLGYSSINIGGMALGLATVILIGLWVHDELTYNHNVQNRDRIGQVYRASTVNSEQFITPWLPYALSQELNENYSQYFTQVMNKFPEGNYALLRGDKSFSENGTNMEPSVIEAFNLNMLEGDKNALIDPYSIILSESLAKKIFQYEDPLGKVIRVNDRNDVIVRGVFEDQPRNSSMYGIELILPTQLNLINNPWKLEQGFSNNFLSLFVEIAPGYTFEEVSEVIQEVIYEKVKDSGYGDYHPRLFIHPMEKWHLYADWDNGVNTGRIRFVKLFSIIGIFILLLACINFMNLSTARSEKRAKEVGIRKSIGSRKKQLIFQFMIESCMMVTIAFILGLVIATLAIQPFNTLADKQVEIPWANPVFWGVSLLFILGTGLIAGSYPSFYLSSFNPIRILKGTFKVGRRASIPRQVLVVVQFSVSVILIIGTVVVYQQIQFAKDRPVGYDREGLVMVEMITDDHRNKFDAIKAELLASGQIEGVAKSLGPVTDVWSSNGGFTWKGNPPLYDDDFATISVSPDYGEVVKWNFIEGRDFSSEFASDSTAVILNQSAAEIFGMENSVGEVIRWEPSWTDPGDYQIVGVIEDVVMRSPFFPNMPAVYFMNDRLTHINLRLKEGTNTADALATAEKIFKKFIPNAPFTYAFADDTYAEKFHVEERVGKLSSVFAILAIVISCLGLFGLASFVAEQKTKEIGIRKVVGASLFTLWKLQATGFLWLVLISTIIAIPIAYFGMLEWLSGYQYRMTMQWWIFLGAIGGALLLTILTVSFQAIRAARINPVLSLRSE